MKFLYPILRANSTWNYFKSNACFKFYVQVPPEISLNSILVSILHQDFNWYPSRTIPMSIPMTTTHFKFRQITFRCQFLLSNSSKNSFKPIHISISTDSFNLKIPYIQYLCQFSTPGFPLKPFTNDSHVNSYLENSNKFPLHKIPMWLPICKLHLKFSCQFIYENSAWNSPAFNNCVNSYTRISNKTLHKRLPFHHICVNLSWNPFKCISYINSYVQTPSEIPSNRFFMSDPMCEFRQKFPHIKFPRKSICLNYTWYSPTFNTSVNPKPGFQKIAFTNDSHVHSCLDNSLEILSHKIPMSLPICKPHLAFYHRIFSCHFIYWNSTWNLIKNSTYKSHLQLPEIKFSCRTHLCKFHQIFV